jgi:hypothetical protein
VLIGATAATSEIRARRFNAMQRRFFNFDQLGFGELFLLADDLGRNEFAFDYVRNENRLALLPADAFAAKGDVFDC